MSSFEAEEKPKYDYPVDGAQIKGAALIHKVGRETFGEIADVIKRLGWANTDRLLRMVEAELELEKERKLAVLKDHMLALSLEEEEHERAREHARERMMAVGFEREPKPDPGLEYELEFLPDDVE